MLRDLPSLRVNCQNLSMPRYLLHSIDHGPNARAGPTAYNSAASFADGDSAIKLGSLGCNFSKFNLINRFVVEALSNALDFEGI